MTQLTALAEKVEGAEGEALLEALHALERLRDLTPFRANETTAAGLHQAVCAIAETALDRLTPALSARSQAALSSNKSEIEHG